jgi:hypothetical protein
MKMVFLFCVITFLAVMSIMILRSDKMTQDPSALPSPSREFNEWRKDWEKQR